MLDRLLEWHMGSASFVEIAWTVLLSAALVYVARNVRWEWRFQRFSRRRGARQRIIEDSRYALAVQLLAGFAELLFVVAGVVAMLTPEPVRTRNQQAGDFILLDLLLAAALILAMSWTFHKQRHRK